MPQVQNALNVEGSDIDYPYQSSAPLNDTRHAWALPVALQPTLPFPTTTMSLIEAGITCAGSQLIKASYHTKRMDEGQITSSGHS